MSINKIHRLKYHPEGGGNYKNGYFIRWSKVIKSKKITENVIDQLETPTIIISDEITGQLEEVELHQVKLDLISFIEINKIQKFGDEIHKDKKI